MKKTFITLLFLALTFCGFAQDKQRQERFKALKVAFITEKLEFTETEAQKFWPIYNAFEKERDMLRNNSREMRRNLKIESLSETDARKLLKDFLAFEDEQQKLKSDLVESLLTAIPAKKVILLKLVEEQFKKQMMEEWKKRHEKPEKNTP
nr:hypothetical protein [uncultured Psychroserpens sp.]